MAPIKCKFCNQISFSKYSQNKLKDHEQICQREEIPCSYGCGENKILRN